MAILKCENRNINIHIPLSRYTRKLCGIEKKVLFRRPNSEFDLNP